MQNDGGIAMAGEEEVVVLGGVVGAVEETLGGKGSMVESVAGQLVVITYLGR